MNKVLIWGIGERTERFLREGFFNDLDIKAFVDSNANEDNYKGYPLYKPQNVIKLIDEIDYVLISNRYYGEIFEYCMELHIPIEKIIITDNVKAPIFRKSTERLKKIVPSIYNLMNCCQSDLIKINERDYQDKSTIYNAGKFDDIEYKQDYFRYRTFEFVCDEIKKAHVRGEVAELGVFRGVFSALINEKFKERKLYLYDTFEGFEAEEAKTEVEKGYCNDSFIIAHKNTSVERMLKNLPYPEMAIVRKGFFPESVEDIEKNETFAFVSLDVDFEESTYQGLKFFYPRMSDGGYMFIHDYNTYYLDGVKNAIERYEKDFGVKLKKVPLADRAGTIVVVK